MAHRRRLQASLAVLAAVSAARGSSGEAGAGGGEAVAAWLASHVKTLTRPVSTYHYAMRTRIGLPAEGSVPDGFDPSTYLGMKISRYWDLSLQPHPFSTASGLYVSTDPVIARGFGGSGNIWALIEVVLQPGFRFIDVRIASDRPADGQKLPPSIRRVLASGGCEVQFAQTLLIAQESRNCREIAVHVMRQLHVDGILYDFPAKRLNPCAGRQEGAFIVIDAAGVRLDTPRVFIAESRSPDREPVHDMFVRAREAGSRLPLPWPDLHGEIDGPQTSAWMKDHIFGCSAYAEDQFLAFDSAASAESLYRSAKALRDAGNLAASVEAYRAVLAADPDFTPALDDLAWIRATSADPAFRNPTEAEVLATHLVDLTHYKFRRSTGGLFAKLYKIHASHTLAAAFAANGKLSRAVDYAMQSIETVRRLIAVDPSPEAQKVLADGLVYLEIYRSGKPFVASPGYVRTAVSMH